VVYLTAKNKMRKVRQDSCGERSFVEFHRFVSLLLEGGETILVDVDGCVVRLVQGSTQREEPACINMESIFVTPRASEIPFSGNDILGNFRG
jgi:hypothetical protein